MDLFLIRVDGLDVAMTDSESAAFVHAWSLASNDSAVEVKIIRMQDDLLQALPRFLVAEAATA